MFKRILLVEDDSDDQYFFLQALDRMPINTKLQIVENGQAALDYLKKTTPLPDIIFLDINMPIMNGIECLRKVKQMLLLQNIPVVVLSTSANDVELATEIGASAYIQKPDNLYALEQKLKKVLSYEFPAPAKVTRHPIMV